jgi:L-cystine transport system substrate-binding protein
MKRFISVLLAIATIFSLTISSFALKEIKLTGLKLNKSAVTLTEGSVFKTAVTFVPANTTQKLVSYSTSNKNVASVDTKGQIKAVSKGKAVVTVASAKNKKIFASITVTVTAKEVAEKKPKVVRVGTGNAFKPFCYLDENGKLQGFEYEVLKEADKRLPEYEFTFETFDFVNILLSLESGKIDLAAHYYAKNAEREKKYLYTDEGVCVATMRILVAKDSNKINNIEDLTGKNVYVSAGSNNAYLAEKYNAEHNNPLKLVYGNLDNATIVQGLVSGTIDATFGTEKTLSDWNTAYGEKLKQVGDAIYDSYTYYIVKKDNVELKTAIDKAIKSMKEDGTLAQIAIKTVGKDVTKRQ